jgi:uncharacterized integral membrane protein (TIGR00697 family)
MIAAIVVSSAYIAAQMMSDITSLKIVLFFGLSMDAGTFVYPITFTLRDLVHKTVGAKGARVLILTAAVINLLMALLFWLVSRMPGDSSVGVQAEFGMVLSPVWRIVVASIVAEVMSEMLDTEVYRLWVERVTPRYQWLRVLVSNSVSVPLDSLVFAWGAFGVTLAATVVWSIVLSNVLVKGATALLSSPLIYAVSDAHTKEYPKPGLG